MLTSRSLTPGVIERTLAEFGQVDILVNNAGIIRRQDAIEYSEQDWGYFNECEHQVYSCSLCLRRLQSSLRLNVLVERSLTLHRDAVIPWWHSSSFIRLQKVRWE
ncbi:SDR family NAD(P)-dependent oxidoreductase [Vibrio chagasii]|nr:SDR family NAD(P)-dependent oxidoreductase [Vibrio chagasii]